MGAEGVGFEPTVAFATTVFKTVAFNRSAIPPSAGDFTIKKKVTLCSLFIPPKRGNRVFHPNIWFYRQFLLHNRVLTGYDFHI
jgi:hypothetical protein